MTTLVDKRRLMWQVLHMNSFRSSLRRCRGSPTRSFTVLPTSSPWTSFRHIRHDVPSVPSSFWHPSAPVSCRLFSSGANTISTNSSIEEMEIQSMRKRVRHLLALPVGTMDVAEAWVEADDALKWWASQQTLESVQTCFKLLDRLVQELKVIPRDDQDDTEDNLITYFDARMVIPTILAGWFEVWQVQVQQNQDMELTPEKLLQRMDAYVQQVPWAWAFRLPGKGISYLFNATLLKPLPYNQTAPFCDYLCDRLWEVMPHKSIMSVYMINTTLDLWAKSDLKDRVQRAESLFARALDHNVVMDLITYNTLLSVYAGVGLGKKAETFLQALLRDHLKGNSPAPDDISFHTVILAYANERDGLQSGQAAAYMLQRMMDPFDDYGRLGIPISTHLFNIVLLAYARAGVPTAGDEAFRVLQEMRNSDLAPPDTISYGTVMDAYGNCGKPEMAEQVFRQQVDDFTKTQDERLRPTATSMTLLVTAYAKSNDPLRVERATEILVQMLRLQAEGILLEGPDTWAYNTVLQCILTSGLKIKQKAEMAESCFRLMKSRAAGGDVQAKPNNWTYSELILFYLDAKNFAKAEKYLREAHTDPSIELDIRTTGRFIFAAAKQGKVQSADFWLHSLLGKCVQEKGRSGTRPSTSLLGAVIGAWKQLSTAKPGLAAKMYHLVNRYERMFKAGILSEPPDSRVYSGLIAGLVRDQKIQSKGKRAFEILQNARRLARESKSPKRIMPDSSTYRDVLRMLVSVEGELETAYELCAQMIEDFRSDPKNFPMPDSYGVEVVLGALSEMGTPEAWDKAMALFASLDDAKEIHDEDALLPIRNRRCYRHMINLAQKLALQHEVQALSKNLDSIVAQLEKKKPPWR